MLPDAIELSRPCTGSELDECLRSLASAVRAREPSEPALRAALSRLASARRRAAADEPRRADALALEALLLGAGVDPLGAAEDDARVDARRVGGFLGAHAGAGRVLLVAVGDVEASALRRDVLAASAPVPRALAERAVRPRERRGACASRSAARTRSPRPCSGRASATRRASRGGWWRASTRIPGGQASAEAFPLRGGAAVIARVRSPADSGARVLLDHLAELAEEPGDAAELAPPREGPRALARWIGAGWAARQEPPTQGSIGVGVLVAGGRGDRVREEDPDRALREAAERAVGAALREASAPVAMEGIDEAGGEASALGASIRAARLAGAARLSARSCSSRAARRRIRRTRTA
ncbi:MAG: hypothetical protein M5U28_32915 [Sandaracinaceae bacterium]|nr:hypothetical protein [Sandaracinaceae bacterium]